MKRDCQKIKKQKKVGWSGCSKNLKKKKPKSRKTKIFEKKSVNNQMDVLSSSCHRYTIGNPNAWDHLGENISMWSQRVNTIWWSESIVEINKHHYILDKYMFIYRKLISFFLPSDIKWIFFLHCFPFSVNKYCRIQMPN